MPTLKHITSFIILISMPVISFSNQKIDFSIIENVDNYIAGKSWSCEMVDTYGASIGTWTFKSVKGKKVNGSVEVPHLPACNSDVLKGKIKKSKIKFHAPNGTPCREVSGTLDFFYDENNIAKASGKYRIGGTHKSGTYNCYLK